MRALREALASLAIALTMVGCVVSADEGLAIDQRRVMDIARGMLAETEPIHYADQWLTDAVATDSLSLWLGSHGLRESADSLFKCLQGVADEGLSPEFFEVTRIGADIDSVRSWTQNGRITPLNDTLLAEIEARLTRAYLRYAYGQRYGFVRPRKLLNHLLPDYDSPNERNRPYRQLFDMPCDVPADSFAAVAIERLRADSVGAFLRSIQPDARRHSRLCREYRRAFEAHDTNLVVKAIVNLERNRWRYARPDTGRYVLVNLAAQSLWAVDDSRDTCLEMRICCGNLTHKSPMLSSSISYIELNPYWNVPMSIVRNEIAKIHVNDSAYFARNNMIATDQTTKEEVDPASLTAAQWCSGRYSLKQDKGKGNSLGRIVFRFPNNFSVYLHDTNAPSAFKRDRRTVSHGCIRVEKPLDLALFLLGDAATPYYADRIRLSVDLPPLTAEGRALASRVPEPMKQCHLQSPVPLWIDYYTLYLDRTGRLREYPDIYSYDSAIASALGPFIRR